MTEVYATKVIAFDRPKASLPPGFEDVIYALANGCGENTNSWKGDGIDVSPRSFNSVMGLQAIEILTGILCTFDTLKHDAEIKLLIGCTEEDIQVIRDFHKEMRTFYILNPMVEHALSNRFS